MKDTLRVMRGDFMTYVFPVLWVFLVGATAILLTCGAVTTIVYLAGGMDALNSKGQFMLTWFWTLAPVVAIIYWVISAIKRGGKS